MTATAAVRPTRRRKATSTEPSSLASKAFEKACHVETQIEGHEDLCTERFKNLDTKVDGVQQDIKRLSDTVARDMQRLNDDAKNAIDDFGQRQEARQDAYHKTNSDSLKALTSGLADLSLQVGVGQGNMAGMGGAVRFVLQYILPIGISAATLITLWSRVPGHP